MTSPAEDLSTTEEQSKLDFLSHVSLQLSTPLSITKEGLAHLFLSIHGKLTEKEEKILKTLMANLDRLSQTVNNLIDAHKIESGKMVFGRKELNAAQILRRVKGLFEPQIRQKGLQFLCPIIEKEIQVYGNEDRIVQVFSILLSNAIQATEQGSIEIIVEEKEKNIECFVNDTGKGIPANYLPAIFSKFKSLSLSDVSRGQGSGLGLAIAKGLVNLHQGKIRVESEVGKGTKVSFTLPKIK